MVLFVGVLTRAGRSAASCGVQLRRLSSSPSQATRVAIVGTGPSGFYTAKYLVKDNPSVHVDLLDALPTPFGERR
jgi:NADPH-dependent glutamate synthase beta subunit-like oxidoreductase